MPETISAKAGRATFGADAQAYHAGRPDYPEALYEALARSGALRAGVVALEIGAGSGIATQALLARRVASLVALEPDPGFRAHHDALVARSDGLLEVLGETFEDAPLAPARFDLVVSATAFHWLDPQQRVPLIARALRPGGHAALWWNVFQDPLRADPFHEATRGLLEHLPHGPSGAPDTLPFALDVEARLAEFRLQGAFEPVHRSCERWTLVLDPAGVRTLYSGFSGVCALGDKERERVLDQLVAVAVQRFDGRVERPMTTPLYVFRRRS